jgi:hypothetical protein
MSDDDAGWVMQYIHDHVALTALNLAVQGRAKEIDGMYAWYSALNRFIFNNRDRMVRVVCQKCDRPYAAWKEPLGVKTGCYFCDPEFINLLCGWDKNDARLAY